MTDYLKNKRVVVTGAAGFLGSHLCEALITAGASVVGIDNFLTGQRRNLAPLHQHPQFTFIEADIIQDPASYLKFNEAIDALLHFASPASPPRYQAHPVETYQANAFATHHLLSWLSAHHPQARFLFASTSEVYGDPQIHPQTEDYWGHVNPNGLRSCYDESKRLGETICGVFSREFALDVRIVRIFNTYGPRMDLEDGRVIPQFIGEALRKEPLSIYGDGSQSRSYCYVSDLVEGILRLLSEKSARGETVNLGNPGEFTIKETAQLIWNLIHPGRAMETTKHPLPADDPTRRRPDVSKAHRLLNWEPKVSFSEGLEKTVEYFKTVV